MMKKAVALTILIIQAACQNIQSSSPLSVSELVKDYARSKETARSKYEGKEITVRGYAESRAAVPKDADSEGVVTLEESDEDAFQHVNCWFTPDNKADFTRVKGRQFITVKGVFSGEITTDLKFCKLLKVE